MERGVDSNKSPSVMMKTRSRLLLLLRRLGRMLTKVMARTTAMMAQWSGSP